MRKRLGPNGTRVISSASLILAAVLLLLVFGGSGGTYTMKAQFDDVRGLIPGDQVRAGAVKIGAVKSVKLVGSDPVVTMTIDNDFKMHQGAEADIQLYSNAGAVNRTVELSLGDPQKPELPQDQTMAGNETDQPVNFDDAAETLDPPTRTNLKHLIIGLDASLKGRGKDFDKSLLNSSEAVNETANLLAQVNSDGLALKTLVSQGSRVTSALASSPGDIASAADRTASLLNVTANRQTELSRSVQLLGPALERGRSALDTLAKATPRVRQLLHDLGPVADELGPFARVLPPALSAAGPFLDQTRQLVDEGPGDLRDFAPVIAAAHNVTGQLGNLLTKVTPLGNQLRAYIPETVGFFQNLGSTLGTYDANGHVLTVAGGLFTNPAGSELSKTLGPADCGPGALAKPYVRLPGALECEPWANYTDSFIGKSR